MGKRSKKCKGLNNRDKILVIKYINHRGVVYNRENTVNNITVTSINRLIMVFTS